MSLRWEIQPLSSFDSGEWQELYQRCSVQVPFYHLEFVVVLIEAYEHDKTKFLLKGFNGDKLEGLCLIETRTNKLGLKTVSIFASRGADHVYPLLIDNQEFKSMILFLKSKGLDQFYSTALHPIISELNSANEIIHWELKKFRSCPYLVLPSSSTEFYDSFKKKVRYNLKRELRIIQENGVILEEWNASKIRDANGLEILNALHAKRFKQKGQHSKFLEKKSQAFHSSIIKHAKEDSVLRMHVAIKDNRVIGALYGFIIDRKYLFFMQGFDPDYQNLSLGKSLVQWSILQGIEKGHTEYDFLRGRESYKVFWTKTVKPNYELRVSMSRRGMLFSSLLNLIKAIQGK